MARPASELDRLRSVSSAQNALVKELRGAFARSEPAADGWIAIESHHIVEEAVRSGLKFRAVFFGESGKARAEKLLPQFGPGVELLLLPDSVFAGAVATETPQGVAALVRPKPARLDDILHVSAPVILIAAGVQDPGNLGTMIRSAEAFGAAAVITTEGTVSAFNPKVIRASAGSLFRVPVLRASALDIVGKLREAGFRLLATSSHKGRRLDETSLSPPLALLVGNEGAGVPRDLLKQVDETVVIPHSEQVESLNAGIAASIVLYEAARHRRGHL